jgi:hypothetical protein
MARQLSASDFLSLRTQYQTQRQAEEIPASIEHLFAQGMMIDHYYVILAPALAQDPELQSLGQVSGILFQQQPDGAPWKVYAHEITMTSEAAFEMAEPEFRAWLKDSAITLPGE